MYIPKESIEEMKKCKESIQIWLNGDDIIALMKGEAVGAGKGPELVVLHVPTNQIKTEELR